MCRTITLFFLCLSFCSTLQADIVKPASNAVNGLYFRETPTPSGRIISALFPKYNDYGYVLREDGDYYQIQFDGIQGYVHKDYASKTKSLNQESSLTPSDSEMVAHFINVGQGDATLLEFSCGAILIDSGGENSDFFNSDNQLKSYLDDFFTRRADLNKTLNTVLVTHPHADHTAGLDVLVENYEINNVIVSAGVEVWDSGGREQIALERFAVQNKDTAFLPLSYYHTEKNKGLTNEMIDPLACNESKPDISALWARKTDKNRWSESDHKNDNNHSIVVRIDFGKSSFLFTGDLQKAGIASLIKHHKDTDLLDVDVYQFGHHASHNATSEELIEVMSPKIAVASMGNPDKRQLLGGGDFNAYKFGHPNEHAIDAALTSPELLDRPNKTVTIGIKGSFRGSKPEFKKEEISKAIYATGWDGDVIVKADMEGNYQTLLNNSD